VEKECPSKAMGEASVELYWVIKVGRPSPTPFGEEGTRCGSFPEPDALKMVIEVARGHSGVVLLSSLDSSTSGL